jgi:hypothetical protein
MLKSLFLFLLGRVQAEAVVSFGGARRVMVCRGCGAIHRVGNARCCGNAGFYEVPRATALRLAGVRP